MKLIQICFLIIMGFFVSENSHAMFKEFLTQVADKVEQLNVPGLVEEAQALAERLPEVERVIARIGGQVSDLHVGSWRLVQQSDVAIVRREVRRVGDQVKAVLSDQQLADYIERALEVVRAERRHLQEAPNLKSYLRGLGQAVAAHRTSEPVPPPVGSVVLGVEERMALRTRIITPAREHQARNFVDAISRETVMRTDIACNFFESLNRLEANYSEAGVLIDFTMEEIAGYLSRLDAQDLGEQGEWKYRAALAGFEQIRYHSDQIGEWNVHLAGTDAEIFGLLSIKQIVNLVWIVLHDPAIFGTEALRKEQELRLVMFFASMMRAHNETAEGEINYDPAQPDQPSCPHGCVIRCLEVLELVHPAVVLQTASMGPTPLEISTTMIQFAREYHGTVGPVNPESVGYQQFRDQLKMHLRTTYPQIQSDSLEASLGIETLEILIEGYVLSV